MADCNTIQQQLSTIRQFLTDHKLLPEQASYIIIIISPFIRYNIHIQMSETLLGKPVEESVADVILFCPWRVELGSYLGSIVLHTVTVMAARKELKLLSPFMKMMTDPKSLEVTFNNEHFSQNSDSVFYTENVCAHNA